MISTIFVVIIFLHNLILLHRNSKAYDLYSGWQKLAHAAPRLFFAVLYFLFFLSEAGVITPIDSTVQGSWVRAGLIYLAVVEGVLCHTARKRR